MWTRSELKEKAKKALNHNYWKVVLVTLIVFMIGASGGAVSPSSSTSSNGGGSSSNSFEDGFEQGFENGFDMGYNDDLMFEDDYYFDEEYSTDLEDGSDASVNKIFDEMLNDIEDMGVPVSGMMAFAGVFILVFVIVLIIVIAFAILISTFIFSPLEVGARRFYFKNLNQPAEVKEVAYAFDHSYKNVVKILFFRNLYTFLWSLLFVIPGIVKSYEYMMIPYLLAENPELTQEQAFALSKQMMTGNKWNAFVLDLSFIGWDILSGCTLGILGIFYVEPYRNLTYAALYEELSLIHGRPAFATQGYAEYTYQQANPYEQTAQSTAYEQPTQSMTYEQPVQNTTYEQPQAVTSENIYTSPEEEI